jgi:glycosyltransferase involved in cell wall biosynthesis
VFATTAWEDPCPIVVFENMLLGKPVACFANSGGAAEQVGDTGIVVEGFSPQKMAMGIADLLNDPDRRGRMGAAARRRVQENFTVNVQAPKILQQIREVVSDNAERGSARR